MVAEEVTKRFREIEELCRRRRAASMGGRMKDDIAAMKQQIRALSEHVDNLTYRVIKIEEGLERLKNELKQPPTRA